MTAARAAREVAAAAGEAIAVAGLLVALPIGYALVAVAFALAVTCWIWVPVVIAVAIDAHGLRWLGVLVGGVVAAAFITAFTAAVLGRFRAGA